MPFSSGAYVLRFEKEGQPEDAVNLARSGREVTTERVVASETTESQRDHYTDKQSARLQFDVRARELMAQGYGAVALKEASLGRRRGGYAVFGLGALWVAACFAYGVPRLETTPEAAVLVFFAAPAALAPALGGALLGTGRSGPCNAVLALGIILAIGWALLTHPRLEPGPLGALAAFSFCMTLLVGYCALLVAGVRGR